jgi:hypothetical protein
VCVALRARAEAAQRVALPALLAASVSAAAPAAHAAAAPSSGAVAESVQSAFDTATGFVSQARGAHARSSAQARVRMSVEGARSPCARPPSPPRAGDGTQAAGVAGEVAGSAKVAADFLKPYVDAATPVVEQAARETVKVATPLVQQGLKSAARAAQDSGLDVDGAIKTATAAAKATAPVAQEAVTAATAVSQAIVNGDPATLTNIAGLGALTLLLSPLLLPALASCVPRRCCYLRSPGGREPRLHAGGGARGHADALWCAPARTSRSALRGYKSDLTPAKVLDLLSQVRPRCAGACVVRVQERLLSSSLCHNNNPLGSAVRRRAGGHSQGVRG